MGLGHAHRHQEEAESDDRSSLEELAEAEGLDDPKRSSVAWPGSKHPERRPEAGRQAEERQHHPQDVEPEPEQGEQLEQQPEQPTAGGHQA